MGKDYTIPRRRRNWPMWFDTGKILRRATSHNLILKGSDCPHVLRPYRYKPKMVSSTLVNDKKIEISPGHVLPAHGRKFSQFSLHESSPGTQTFKYRFKSSANYSLTILLLPAPRGERMPFADLFLSFRPFSLRLTRNV